jgi:hypothetical protein
VTCELASREHQLLSTTGERPVRSENSEHTPLPEMEIPAAAIHRLQSSIREAASAPHPSPSRAPFPSFADAVAAFDPDPSPELFCGRCGAAGGLLRGAQSAVCAYCGSPRREEDDGIPFRGSAAYRWLLGSLRLDGSVSSFPHLVDLRTYSKECEKP